jgi:UDP-N-acetylmuramoylalanine--D-glutamate ligase
MTLADWLGRRFVVAGLGVSGAAAARALLDHDSRVLVVDDRDDAGLRAVADELRARGAEIRLGDAETPVDADVIITSPGWRPTKPLLLAAAAQGVEIIGEPELAQRLQPQPGPAWLAVTGTNGKTTTVGMLTSILSAAGFRVTAAGNVGHALTDVVRSSPPPDVLVVELSSFQLHWSPDLVLAGAGLLNIAPDHLDWHGSMAAYIEAKSRVLSAPWVVYNIDDPTVAEVCAAHDRAISFSITSDDAAYALRDGALSGPDHNALMTVTNLPAQGPHNVANALAASAMARTFGAPVEAVAAGLSKYRPAGHRNALVASLDDVAYVDDSKATNPHAAAASLSAYDNVVWIAGGLLKGATVDDLVVAQHDRLRGVVLIGVDRGRIRDALARHAPDVPVVEVEATDTRAMTAIVSEARRLAAPGDTVLLAPAAASMDMFRDYAERGDAFAAAVRRLAEDSA